MTTLDKIVRSIPKTIAAIDAAVLSVTALFLPDRLIPSNLDVLNPVASLLVIVAFLATVAFAPQLQRRQKQLVILSAIALAVVVALQIGFVETVPEYGGEGSASFMTGFALTDQGAEWIAGLGELSKAEYIRDIGADRISRIWGWSFFMNAGLYTGSYLSFVFCMVLAIGGMKGEPKEDFARSSRR